MHDTLRAAWLDAVKLTANTVRFKLTMINPNVFWNTAVLLSLMMLFTASWPCVWATWGIVACVHLTRLVRRVVSLVRGQIRALTVTVTVR